MMTLTVNSKFGKFHQMQKISKNKIYLLDFVLEVGG